MNYSKSIQLEICKKYNVEPFDCPDNLKLGISRNVRDKSLTPLNGMRCKPEADTVGWYIWVGEWSNDPNFFVPLHVSHILDWAPLAYPYLLLPPGYRFLVTENYEDVWYDEEVLTF